MTTDERLNINVNDINDNIETQKVKEKCEVCELTDCSNTINFKNLLVVPKEFCPVPPGCWDSLNISVKPNLHCQLSICSVLDAKLVYTDPCGKSHKIENYSIRVKKARVVGCIDYIISASYALTDVDCPPASVSGFYTIHVDRVIEFLDDLDVCHCSVYIKDTKVCFDNPPEFMYGNDHALKIKGEFELGLGYIRNGSFERNLAGWKLDVPSGAETRTGSSFDTYEPIEGNYFALMKTNGPGAYNEMEQSFYAEPGDKICGWSFFLTNDYFPYDDNCEVSLYKGNDKIATLFFAYVTTVGDYGRTPWTYWEHKITEKGKYKIKAKIANVGDSSVDSYMGLDAIKLTSKK